MRTRVTMTLEPAVHARARHLARARRTTVSGLVASLVRSAPAGGPSRVDAMVGAAELREPAPGSDPLYDALRARHISRRR